MAPGPQFNVIDTVSNGAERTTMLISTLGHRMAQAAKLRGAHAQIVHTISRNFTIRDTNQTRRRLARKRGEMKF